MDLDPNLIAAVKGFEGFTPKAQWDYKQHSNGYGTKAQSPGEVIDPATAETRLTSELGKAQAQVDAFAPNAPAGPRKALSSLTFNAGPGWMNSGLGQAVKAGDWDKAQSLFLTYNKAGGQENSGLTSRRQQEASWFGQPQQQAQATAQQQPAPFQAIPPSAPPAGIGLFGSQMAGGAPSAPQGNPGAAAGSPPQTAPMQPMAPPTSFFAQMAATGAPQQPMPMFAPPRQQQQPVDLSKLYQFLASQQVS